MSEQLSQLIQQSLSPVHQALHSPQPPPSYLQYQQNPHSFINTPGPSPHYNPKWNMAPAVVNHALRIKGAMNLYDDANTHSPTAWSLDQGDRLAADPLGRRVAASEEMAIRGSSNPMPFFSSGLNAAALAGSFLLPGGLAMQLAGGMGLGYGANVAGNFMDNTFFGRARDYRQMGMMLRGRLTPGSLGDTFGTDATGVMRHDVAQHIANQVYTLERGEGRFSGKEFMRMTDKMAQFGMLRDVSTEGGLIKRVKEISEQLKIFAKIANEGDVLEALKQMAQLRNLGISDANLNQAASNARAFARMAGLTKHQMQTAGMEGAQVFNQMGLSGASGYQLGMLNRGLATANMGIFSRGMLAQMGGAPGIAQQMTAGIGAAQQHQTALMLMHSFFDSQGKGQFNLNTGALNQFMSGKADIGDLFNRKVGQLQQSGDMLQHIQDFKERLPELREGLQQRLGPVGMQLFTIRQAQALRRLTGGRMTTFTALQHLTGNEQQARVLARMMTSPQATGKMLEHLQFENRRRALSRRAEIEYQGGMGARFKRWYRNLFGRGISRRIASWAARGAQVQRDRAAGVYGSDPVADMMLKMNERQRNEAILRMAQGKGMSGASTADSVTGSTGLANWSTNPWMALSDRVFGGGIQNNIAMEFAGYDFTGGRLLRGLKQSILPPSESRFGFRDRALLTQKELYDRALDSARVSRKIFDGSHSSVMGAIRASRQAREAASKATGIDAGVLRQLMRSSEGDIRDRMKELQGWFSHGKLDANDIRNILLKRAGGVGIKGEQLNKLAGFLRSREGDDLTAAAWRNMHVGSSDDQKRIQRAQGMGHTRVGGGMFDEKQEELLTNISEQFGFNASGEGSGIRLDRESTSELGSFLTGLSSDKGNVTHVLEYLRARAKGDGSGRQYIENLLENEKDPKKREALQKLFERAVKGFDKLSNRNDILTHLKHARHMKDSGSIADTLLGNKKNIDTIELDRRFRNQVEKDLGISLDKQGYGLDSLISKARKDRSILDKIKDKQLRGWVDEAGQDSTDSKRVELLRQQIAKKVLGRTRDQKAGVTSVDTRGSTNVARQQMQFAQQLHQHALANARITVKFGSDIDRFGKIVSGDKDSFHSAVSKFSNAVDRMSLGGGPKTKR